MVDVYDYKQFEGILNEHQAKFQVDIIYADDPQRFGVIPFGDSWDLAYFSRHMPVNLPRIVTKFGQRCHVDSFFATGRLRLGTLLDFATYEHSEIGDPTEGHVIVIVDSPDGTTVARIAVGDNELIFCTFSGDGGTGARDRLGHDDGFVINDPSAFAETVGKSIGATRHTLASCIYSDRRAIRSIDRLNGRPELGLDLLPIAGLGKYILKTQRFAYQNEVRMIFGFDQYITEPLIIDCPDAIKYCTRLA